MLFKKEEKHMLTKKLESVDTSKQAILTRKLIEASKSYYNGMNSGMSDMEFDKLLEELSDMERTSGFTYENSPTIQVGATVVTELKPAQHAQPALSLAKEKYRDRENLVGWLADKPGVLSWKCDGLTNVLTYMDGKLVSSVTRGDGYVGSDNTHNAVFFEGVPTQIPFKEKLVIRGEAMMEYADFDKINEEAGGIYENPRNLAAATVQMLDSNESRKRRIVFHAFKLVEPTPSEQVIMLPNGKSFPMSYERTRFDFLTELGFHVVEHCSVNSDNILEKIDEFEKKIKTNPYPTDGLVLSYDNQVFAESLGNTNKHPRGSIAMKWTDETISTTVRGIHWSVGKTGQITPVVVFDKVRLGLGSNVTRASAHNLSILKSFPETDNLEKKVPLMIGSKAEVYLANMIIPQIASIKGGEQEVKVPEKCPVCNEPTHVVSNNGIEVLYCRNYRCPARTRGMLENAFCKDGLNVKGLGPSQIEDLQETGLITIYPAELFQLKRDYGDTIPEALAKLEGWGKKSWENLLAAIEKSRNADLRHFLYSLGVPMLGNDLSKKLSKYWKNDISKFMAFYENPNMEELINLDGVGEIKARNLADWCKSTHHDAVKDLFFHALVEELNFAAPEVTSNEELTLSGMTFVITGSVHHYKNRDEFKESVEARGGKVAGSVSKNTNYLVNNDLESTSGKNKKAKELNIPIISEDEFVEKFGK